MIEYFSLKSLNISNGEIYDIIDGDSLIIIFKLFENLYKFRCRLVNINVPELNSTNENEQLKLLL